MSLLSRRTFVAGALAPSDDHWAFEPAADRFSDAALLDLRYLNEKTAGATGFVRVAPDGGFLRGDGAPLRFWAVNTDVAREAEWKPRPLGRKTAPDLARHARFLAKRGVNLVRMHAHLNPPVKARPDAPIDAIDENERAWIWRTVAAMKREGIYSVISPYWANSMRFNAAWNLPGGAEQDAHGLLFFDRRLQAAYRAWWKALLTAPNPHTGVPLAKEPAVAILQLQNEDSLLFWTVNKLGGEYRRELARRFGAWCARKHGSVAAALKYWDGNAVKGDAAADGLLDFHNIYEMTQPRTGGVQRRLDDQLQFWSETMHEFNAATAAYLRKELGCRHLINAGNWKTADTRLEDAERWSYTACDVLAVNRYYSGVHKGKNNGWAIMNGDQFTSPSVLLDARGFPLNLKQVRGRPMMVTESSWTLPNAFATEGPFLVSAYQSLTGLGAYFWFATGDDEWTPPQSANGYQPSQRKWTFAMPDVLGTFPAAALAYREGLIQRGEPVVEEHRALVDLWRRRAPIIAESPSFDPNRDAGDIAPESSVKTGVDPLAFLAGPVHVVYGGNPKATRTADLGKLISGPTVTSITGEIALNNAEGFCTVNAPAVQGVAAFFRNRREFRLRDVVVNCDNQYAAVMVVAMDGKPIARSRKVLVQVGTRSRPTGWRESPVRVDVNGGKSVDGFVVDDYGKAPWSVECARVRLRVGNALLRTATALDMNGEARGEVRVEVAPGVLRFEFPRDAMYVVLR